MKKQTVVPKKRRGPAPTGKGTQVQVRLQPEHLAMLDRWIVGQEVEMTRPEGLRQVAITMLEMLEATDKRYAPAVKAFLERRQSVWSTKNRVED